MELYLIRHAHAVDGEELRDDDRPLSAEGRRQALEVGAALAHQDVRFDRIVMSPLVRAVETASLVAVATGFASGLEIGEPLRPEGSWKTLVRVLLEPALAEATGPLALVGHEPSMGHFLSKLLQHKGLSLGKGAVVRLRLASLEAPAQLVWTLSPKRLEPSADLG